MFFKDNANKELDFCEVYTLGKQHKVYSHKAPVNITDKPEVRLYVDLFAEENTLPCLRGYKDRAILIDETTRIRFLMTINSKDAICDKSKILFRKFETFTDKKM